jgi:hypothetical protein
VTDRRFQAKTGAAKRWSGRYDPVLTVVSDSADRDGSAAASSVLDELVREGARRMPAEALQAEVDADIARFADVRDEKGHRLVVRNGCHRRRDVLTGAGSVEVSALARQRQARRPGYR